MDLIIKGNWNLVKGKLKAKYGELTDDDLAFTDGEETQMIGRIQKKLGKSKNEVITELSDLFEEK